MSDTIENLNKNKDITEKTSGGQPGNQNAKKKPFTDMFKRHLLANPEKLEKIIAKLVDDAVEGNLQAAKEIMDRVEGKAVQATEISGPDGVELVKGIAITFVEGHGNQD